MVAPGNQNRLRRVFNTQPSKRKRRSTVLQCGDERCYPHSGGHRAAATEELLPLVYQELRKLAAAKLSREKPDQTLQATALVHEAYLRLIGSDPAWDCRGHFFAAAAEAMRRILIDSARRKSSQKRVGEYARLRPAKYRSFTTLDFSGSSRSLAFGGSDRVPSPPRLSPFRQTPLQQPPPWSVAYAAYPGEKPVFSSGRQITGWTKVTPSLRGLPKEASGKLWAADVSHRFFTLYDAEGLLPRARSVGFLQLSIETAIQLW